MGRRFATRHGSEGLGGIRVSCSRAAASRRKLETFGSNAPLGRPGQPIELAPVYVFLASQEASYVTGQVYGATGGTGTT